MTEPRNVGEALCVRFQGDIERALNYEMISAGRLKLAFEPFLMAVKQDVLNSSKLAEAFHGNPGSAINSLVLAAQCKLLPGSSYGLFYLIPRAGVVTPLIGYKGLADMAQRHPRVHSVESFLVYDGEEFDYEPGSGRIHHKWNPKIDRPKEAIIAAYSKVIVTEASTNHVVDTPLIHALTIKEILTRHRARSEAWKYAEKSKRFDSPWHNDFEAMVRKSPLRVQLSNGSVPRDMGIGGAMNAESQLAGDDRPQVEIRPRAPSRQDEVRGALGLDPAPAAQEPFQFVEEAVDAIYGAESEDAVAAVLGRAGHFQGGDADVVQNAKERRLAELA